MFHVHLLFQWPNCYKCMFNATNPLVRESAGNSKQITSTRNRIYWNRIHPIISVLFFHHRIFLLQDFSATESSFVVLPHTMEYDIRLLRSLKQHKIWLVSSNIPGLSMVVLAKSLHLFNFSAWSIDSITRTTKLAQTQPPVPSECMFLWNHFGTGSVRFSSISSALVHSFYSSSSPRYGPGANIYSQVNKVSHNWMQTKKKDY